MLCETLPRLEADEYPGGLWYYEPHTYQPYRYVLGRAPAGQKMGALWGEQSEKYLKGEKLLDTVSFAKEMGKRPLMSTPGEKWMYGASADIMGAVIEVVCL